MNKKVIISGGGIAGLTAAKLLVDSGYDVTVIDQAAVFNEAGFLLSLKSFGMGIMKELGLEAAIREASSPSKFMKFVSTTGDTIRELSYERLNSDIDGSLLITRGGLHRVLYESIQARIDIQFRTTVSEVVQQQDQVAVTFSTGETVYADLLVIAEGLRSGTRNMCFTESSLVDFQVSYMGGRLKGRHRYKVGHFNTFIDRGRMLSIYPIHDEELAIQCYIQQRAQANKRPVDPKQLLQETFNDYPPDVQRIVAGFIEEGQVFADQMGMVISPTLANNRVVLLGDAGYCPTALSGMGASLSIYGAKALHHFLQQTPDNLPAALQSFSHWVLPIARSFQDNARKNSTSFLPKNNGRLALFKLLFGYAPLSFLYKKMADQLVLTDAQLTFQT